MLTTSKPPAQPRPVYWRGSTPVKCDLCDQPLDGKKFVDGSTKPQGTWGILDLRCHRIHGNGLGTGRGQLYERQDDGRYLKIEG